MPTYTPTVTLTSNASVYSNFGAYVPTGLIGPFVLSNGWLVFSVQTTSSNGYPYDIYVSTNGGDSFYRHCSFSTYLAGLAAAGTTLFGFSSTQVCYADLTSIAVGSNVIWSSFNHQTWGSSSNPPETSIRLVSSNGTIYMTYSAWDGDGNLTDEGARRGTLGGTWLNLPFTPAYQTNGVVEHGGYIYSCTGAYATSFQRYDPSANTVINIANPALNGTQWFELHSNPEDGLLYALGMVPQIGTNSILYVATFDGSSWTTRYNLNVISNDADRLQSQIDSTGTIHLFKFLTNANGQPMYYGTFTNTGTTFSGFASLGTYYAQKITNTQQFPNGPYFTKFVGNAWIPGTANSNTVQVWVYKVNSAPNAPTPFSYAGGNGACFNNSNTMTLNWQVSDPDGENITQYHLIGSYNDFGTWHYDPGVQPCNVGSGGVLSVNIPASALAESNHWSFALMVADSNGAWSNWGYYSYFTVDKTNPTVSSLAGAANVNVQPGGTFRVWAYGVADALSGVQIVRFPTSRQGVGDWLWKDGVNAGNGNWYCDIPISDHGNAEAVYQTDVYVYDNAGNSPFVGSVFSTVDRTPPTYSSPSVGTTPVNLASGQTKAVSINIADNLSGAAVVDAYYSSSAGGSWTQYLNGVSVSGGVATMQVPITVEGTYYADFYVRDNAGNNCATWPIRLSFVIDRTAPSIASVQGYSFTNVKTGTRRVWAYGVADALSGVASMAATYLKPGGSRTAITAYQSNSDWYVDVPLDGATEGEWNVQFQAADRAGNLSAVATTYFFVDTQRANDPNPGTVWGQTQATITWSGFADPLPSSGYQNTQLWLGEWDGTNWAGGAPNIYNGSIIDTTGSVSQKAAAGLTPGKRYRYTVAYYDKAGNQSAFTWHEFVTKRKIGEQRVKTSSGTVSLPVYDPASGVVGSTAMRTKVASGTGCFELVAPNDINASPLHVKTTQGIWSVSKFGGT